MKGIVNSGSLVYHKDGCPHIKEHAIKKTVTDKYRPCKFCGGIRGWARIFHRRPERQNKERYAEVFYDEVTANLYVRTENGFWRLYWQPLTNKWHLWHLNVFDPEMDSIEMVYSDFHRQTDVEPTDNFDQLIDYIVDHDRSKKIIETDYRRLPQKTKKQRKYYKQAERKAKRDSAKRLDTIFKELEEGRK